MKVYQTLRHDIRSEGLIILSVCHMTGNTCLLAHSSPQKTLDQKALNCVHSNITFTCYIYYFNTFLNLHTISFKQSESATHIVVHLVNAWKNAIHVGKICIVLLGESKCSWSLPYTCLVYSTERGMYCCSVRKLPLPSCHWYIYIYIFSYYNCFEWVSPTLLLCFTEPCKMKLATSGETSKFSFSAF